MSQEKEAHNKFCKTCGDKEIEKVTALENKVKVLDDIVYKTDQSVQTMNMLNRNCKTSFVKPEYLKKAQRVNPRLYVIGCYNDNIALMLAPESDKMIRLAQESRYLIKPFDYKNLNNRYDLFVPQREKSPEQRYFSKRSKMSHTSVKNDNSIESFNKHTTLLEIRMDESIPYVKFGNDQIAPILVQGNGNDLLTSSRGSDLYSITLQDIFTPNLICLMAKATSSQAWLWHRRLSHLNFNTINLLSKYDILMLSTARTPKQNGVVERRNHTLVEAARTMLSAAKVPLYFWAEAIATIYGENLDKMKGKGDACIFVGLNPGPQSQENVPQAAEIVTTSNELDLLFSPMFDELLNGTTTIVSKSSVVTATDAPNQRQQQNTTQSTSTTIAADIPPLNIQTTPETTNQALTQAPTQAPTVTDNENIIQAETNKEYAQVNEDEFINIFCTPTKDHLLEQVIGNPSQSIRTRRQLETDGEMCMFALTVSQIKPKNIKEAMADSAWIEAMQEELHQFD
ncbi:retrovirus-related pol polyprotein from transposon TNT 1-94 [Tanacetum coccineum]